MRCRAGIKDLKYVNTLFSCLGNQVNMEKKNANLDVKYDVCEMRMHAQHPSSVLSIFSKLTSWLIQFRSQYQDNNMFYLLNAYPNDEKKIPHWTDQYSAPNFLLKCVRESS